MKISNYTTGLLLVLVAYTACTQTPTNPPPQKARSANYTEAQLLEADTSRVPMSMVRHVRLARNGDILIASYLGVYRYDGTSFTNLTREIIAPRFASFWDALEDRNGNLWLASKDSGLYCIRGKSVQHFTTKDGLSGNMMLHIYEDRAGNLWFGSTLYDGKTFRTLTTRDGYPVNHIRLLLEDSTGKRWFGAQQEDLFVFDGKTFTVLKDSDGKPFNNVWSVIEDKKGNIWFGATDGLWRYDGRKFIHVSPRGAYAIIQDSKGNIFTTGPVNSQVWAFTRYDHQSVYESHPAFTEIKSGRPMDFLDLVEATDGSIWFSSSRGVHRYDGHTITDFKTVNR
ncbi:MAG: histidine kinase [Cyclobacteriaceae bacterium]|nr:MAG: histidine kinase [Cyclobacteriaceae bacterium]